jgi:4-hydroxybenzoyl-CoA reductase subunit beta
MTLTDIVENEIIKRDYPVIAAAARTISTPILRNMGTIGGNLLLDTRCNYYDQNYEWRKAIQLLSEKRTATSAGSRREVRSAGPFNHQTWCR